MVDLSVANSDPCTCGPYTYAFLVIRASILAVTWFVDVVITEHRTIYKSERSVLRLSANGESVRACIYCARAVLIHTV